MSLTRRVAMLSLGSAAVASVVVRSAHAETTQYTYDALGRIALVSYADGSSVQYSYDAAGNRTQVVRSATTPSSQFTATIQITGTGPVNLRTLANTAGYTGDKHATVTFQLASNITLTGTPGSPDGMHAIDSGDWPYTLYAISVALQISGKANGGGGKGGNGNGNAGGKGGDAVYCRIPMSVTVNSGGELKAGGGGGGGGGRARINVGGEFEIYGGGGGGGGRPNGGAGSGGSGPNGNGTAGTAATTTTTGTGGAGAYGNDGGNGGTYATAGVAGATAYQAGGVGGAAGYGIRKNGNAVLVTNNGTITGTVG